MEDWGWIIVAVAVLLLIGVVIGFYTRRGTQISEHPQGQRRGARAPGARGQSETSGRDEGERTELQQHGTKP